MGDGVEPEVRAVLRFDDQRGLLEQVGAMTDRGGALGHETLLTPKTPKRDYGYPMTSNLARRRSAPGEGLHGSIRPRLEPNVAGAERGRMQVREGMSEPVPTVGRGPSLGEPARQVAERA